jgi:hypothetical protein
MRSHEINRFLINFDAAMNLAEQVRASIHAENLDDSVARFIRFTDIEGEPLDFKAAVFQGRFVARFEISKHTMRGQTFMAGQYAFFEVVNGQEVRLPFAVRFVPQTHVVLPDDSTLEIPDAVSEEGKRYAVQQATRVKDAISEALVSYVIEKSQTWTLDH